MFKLFAATLVVFAMQSRGLAQADSSSSPGLEELKGQVEGMNESLTEMRGVLDALKKIKVSGYLQTQFKYTDLINQPYPIGNFSGGQFPANTKNLFQVRRGRLKVNYDNVLTQFVIQIDVIPTGLSLKDAYLSLIEPWTQSLGLQLGVFDRPFGYEISYSSGSRESPERSRLFQTLFPGERELGGKLFYAPQLGSLRFLRADIGLFNGSGPNANEFDNFKDVIGHIAVQLPLGEESPVALDLGVSGYFGKVRSNSKDIFYDGDPVAGVKGFVKNTDTANVSKGVTRSYIGGDAQLYYDIPSVGGLIVRAEYITGSQPGTSATTVSPSAQPTTALYKRKFAGWYVNLVQNIGDKEQIIMKYDVYDPNTNVQAADFTTTGSLTVADIKYSTLGLGFIHHWDANVKFVLYYEIIKNEILDASRIPASATALFPYTQDVRDDVFTFRVQYRF
jgi:hypothetical protein